MNKINNQIQVNNNHFKTPFEEHNLKTHLKIWQANRNQIMQNVELINETNLNFQI